MLRPITPGTPRIPETNAVTTLKGICKPILIPTLFTISIKINPSIIFNASFKSFLNGHENIFAITITAIADTAKIKYCIISPLIKYILTHIFLEQKEKIIDHF